MAIPVRLPHAAAPPTAAPSPAWLNFNLIIRLASMADSTGSVAVKPENGGGPSRAARMKAKRKERKKTKKEQQTANSVTKANGSASNSSHLSTVKNEPREAAAQPFPPGVEIEYVAANPLDELSKDDPMYEEFASIFAKFSAASEDDDTSQDVEMVDAVEQEEKKPVDSDDSDEEEENTASKVSNRKRRQQRRLNISVLKQIVKRPDLVEIHDCSAPDPLFAIHLKGYRNSIPIPKHWAQRRKYLQARLPASLFLFFCFVVYSLEYSSPMEWSLMNFSRISISYPGGAMTMIIKLGCMILCDY